MTEHKYGRGKFETHPNYIKYMNMIVDHPNYAGIKNARSQDGRINWQVSSGKTTSFYKDYLARRKWWVSKADELGLPGTDDENDRFTVAARLIHPTGYRVCRICGQETNIGYFYVNHNLGKKLNRHFQKVEIEKGQSLPDVLRSLGELYSSEEIEGFFIPLFPERHGFFDSLGVTAEAFENSRHMRTNWLSPGFMGNPPDRLDGFHDYDLKCRKKNDPGRHDENMRSYNHDRRSFEWWAEGDWALADALYNSAGPGQCFILGCDEKLKKVSPDHIGPLACGFKQLPFFNPTCQSHNSAKNRRFSIGDVGRLISYEEKTGHSTASWQVRAHWDAYKTVVENDNQTKALSNSMRSLQDMYLRVLWKVVEIGKIRFLATLLHPEHALKDIELVELDSGALTYKKALFVPNNSMLRKQLCIRTVRIAFESLHEYTSKKIEKRKMVRADFNENTPQIEEVVGEIRGFTHPDDAEWRMAFKNAKNGGQLEDSLTRLMPNLCVPRSDSDQESHSMLQRLFDDIGTNAEIDFSRYEAED